ncbi:class I SAM-dependent methyltransferase [Kribbella capetownensis]|uniref:Class I SAM-dependent methyltransferase n=1 Tax=Kribbella capetownensis TaxID=1572659 RepID=A0A4R0K699_9ACTN|nr:class I SAM-dependent methyltransferase [Kribbella capetownensis]TCC53506.1 class I SAM-dependent methyltransferase [Kribbella capetownensis]
MRYYYREHEAAYRRLRQQGMTQWSDLFGETEDFEEFPNRGFLEGVLGRLVLPSASEVEVLEYGCGTGPAACLLAARGFRVDAVDLIPEAIELARRFAQERGAEVSFGVQDICALAAEPVGKRYDLIVDSYCLQSIVTDADRARVFAAVRGRLKDKGYYLISTAMYEPDRSYDGGFRYDEATGICYQQGGAGPDAVEIDGVWYVPHRRHLSAAALRAELKGAELHVVSQEAGNLVCTRNS